MHQRDYAVEVVRQLQAAGHEALWAGGCVRDQLLGLTPQDYDVATSALPEEVRELFGQRRTLAIGAAFGVITVLGGKGSNPIEVATFRSDGEYLDGRHPDRVEFTTAEADAQRRDFTVNGMFYDPLEQRIVDYVGGQVDLNDRIIRAIGDPADRFAEDKLRILRAVRFATTYEFEVAPETLAAIAEMASEVTAVSAERIGSELGQTLAHGNRRRGAELLVETGLLRVLMPEFAQLDDRAWQRTLQRLDRLGEATFPTTLAALLLDVASGPQVKEICRRFRFTNKTADRAAWLVTQLPTVEHADSLAWPRLQRVLVNDGRSELLALAEAQWSADHPGVVTCRQRLAAPADELDPSPLVGGDDLIAEGLTPGKHFADLLEHLRDQQLEGRLSSRQQALEEAKRWVQDRGAP